MPLDRASHEAAERCAHCPKMCRFSCPVAEESGREVLSPGGKMTLATLSVPVASARPGLPKPLEALAEKARRLVEPGPRRELDADTAEAFYGCTGCLRCQTWCDHGNDVPTSLLQARAHAASRGVAPAAARLVKDRFEKVGHAEDASLPDRLAALASELPAGAGATSVMFAGCEAPFTQPDALRAAVRASRRLGAPLGIVREPVCCGRPLLEAGFRDEFRAHVHDVWARLGDREVVTPSAACAVFLTRRAKEVGVEPRGPVVHLTVHLARRLGPAVQARPLPYAVAWHDPCHLVRGLGEADAPRRLLRAALSGGVREPASTRAEADCCGASGLVPRTFPELARAMAMSRADELRGTGAQKIATACPACRGALSSSGLDVLDVAEIVDAWLEQEPSGEQS